MKNHIKFTHFLKRKNMHKPNKRMNKLIETNVLSKSIIALLLVFASTVAYSQCAPQLTLSDGTKSTSGTFCEGQLISFTANSPGYVNTSVTWDFGDGPPAGTSSDENVTYSFEEEGDYTVTFTGSGFAGNCSETLEVKIRASPDIYIQRTNDSLQCYRDNLFCFKDSSLAPNGLITSQRYVFSDGQDTTITNPTFPFEFCVNFADPLGGLYDVIIESRDTSGCLRRIEFKNYFEVSPKIGASYLNLTPPPNPGCREINGIFQNTTTLPFAAMDSFKWVWTDGTEVQGSQTENQEWWNGPANDGIVSHLYTTAGTFFPNLIASAYGCSDTFVSKASVVNIILEPKIIAITPACAPYQPVFTVTGMNGANPSRFLWNFGQPPWANDNLNDQNFSPVRPNPSYGPGIYMISLNVVAGPCNVTVYDTIEVVGPGTTIEVPFDRVPLDQTYQCIIEDTVCMTNNSSFYRNDFDRTDEDSVVYYPSYSFDRIFQLNTGQFQWRFREWEEDPYGNKIVSDSLYASTADTISEQGYKVYYDAAKDSIAAINTNNVPQDTTWHKESINAGPSYRFGLNNRLRYVFNYAPPANGQGIGGGDQVAIPLPPSPLPNRDYRPNVWRVWTMGDNFAPQCTTDSRPWVNQNVGINCNYVIDSAPCHWYTPWDEIYRTFQDGRNYTQPFLETRINKALRECYQVSVYANDTMITPKKVVMTVPSDSSLTYYITDENGNTLDSIVALSNGDVLFVGQLFDFDFWDFENWYIDTAVINAYRATPIPNFEPFNLTLRRPQSAFYGTELYYDILRDSFVSVNNRAQRDTLWHNADSLGRNNPLAGNGTTKWTVTYNPMRFNIPAGVTIDLLKLEPPIGAAPGGAAPGTTQTITGPQTVTIDPDWQFSVRSNDSIFTQSYIDENPADTVYAQPSNYVTQEVIFGIETRVVKQAVFIDSAGHRENWFLDNASCNTVTLWQKDTIHPLLCESEGIKQLALIPPNAKGLEWVSGAPCPFDGANFNYILEFSIAETKPGCSQQWFAVNYDTFSFDHTLTSSWTVYNSGGVFGAKPAIPIPFVLPYDIAGNTATTFFRSFTSGQIGNPYDRDPIGSFAFGLIVGNGAPIPGVTPANHPTQCLDTFYYPDLFRILPLDATFEIVYPRPTADGKYYMCAGDTAYFKFNTSLQDSIRNLRWNWGYPATKDFGRGPKVSYYFENFQYYQPYEGPVAGRNDEDIIYNGENWLYNYVVRTNTYSLEREGKTDVFITDTLEVIVTSIIKDWKVVAVKTNTDQLIKDAFEQLLGLTYSEIPPDEVALYLGDGTVGCLDTSGISQFFAFGNQIYSEKNRDFGVFRKNNKVYRVDTNSTPHDTIETQHILHFRDSSVIGFDTLLLDTNANGVLDTLTGLYRHIYRYKELVIDDECNPGDLDTVELFANGAMTPGPILNSTVGCENRAAKFLNVGFLNNFSLQNNTICKGTEVVVENYIRYYQYGEEDPFTYPIKDSAYWLDATRYVASPTLETFMADWDASTEMFDSTRSIPELRWTYDTPGEYDITVVAQDSIGCTDTTMLRALVSEVYPDFGFGDTLISCASIVNFSDSTTFYDPCAAKDTCTNGTDLSCEQIVSWSWDFGDNTRKSLLQNPAHNYTSAGLYTVNLIVTTKLGCTDSIKKTLIIPGPQPEFGFRNKVWRDKDTAEICAGDMIEVVNFSQGDISPIFDFDWGDKTNSNPGAVGDTFRHTYLNPGVYELYMTQEDEINGVRCQRIFPDTSDALLVKRKIVVIVNSTPDVTIEADPLIVCPNELITFTATMDARYTRISWIMGNGDTINEPEASNNTLTYSYAKDSTYQIILAPEYDQLPRCWSRDTIEVTVESVTADFSIDSSASPKFCFTDESVFSATATGTKTYEWFFEDEEPTPGEGYSTEKDDCYDWADRKGTWNVCHVATTERGCTDTICKPISHTFVRRLVPYNVFTPGTDQSNNTFVIDGESLDKYSIKIFNRWGERVFETEDINISWNGQVNNTGLNCPAGTYFYIINYTFRFGQENEGLGPIEGTVDLIR